MKFQSRFAPAGCVPPSARLGCWISNLLRGLLRGIAALAAGLLIAPAYSSPHNPDTDWFRDAGWGVFVHYLWDVQNVGGRENAMGKPPTSWDALVREFDTEKFAEQVKEIRAPYVIFTMMQRTRHLIAPNATFDRLTGYKPGEACSTRDLVADLHRSLDRRGIKLMLYWTGDGPREDAQAAKGMGGWDGRVNDRYVQNWADVAAEYSRRYGDKVKGWWTDGCYAHIGYSEPRWRTLAAALKAGNPHAIIALNNPSMSHANSSTDCDDFTTGEVNKFADVPDNRWRDGKQFHVLSYLGGDWGKPGCRYDLAFLAGYVSQVNRVGGVVTIDVALFRDGSLDPSQVKLLSQLRSALADASAKVKSPGRTGPGFREQIISTAVKFGYQLVAADLNGDGKKDLITVDEQATEVAWFENPIWERHVLATQVPRPLNAACCDIDSDGIPEVVLAYRFESRPEQSVGNVVLLTHGKDVRQPWTAREIDRVPTAHRVRWIDPEGSGKKMLLLGPMVGQRFPPVEGDPVPVYLYRPGQWQRETISTEPRGVLHAINPIRWDGTGREQLLTASYAGIHRMELIQDKWTATQISKGDPRPWPLCGSSEIRLGSLGPQRILVAIEPWHGNQAVVYLPEGTQWKRVVIEDGMENGHALAVGDLNGDGRDEIVCGYRGKGRQLFIFEAVDPKGERWQKSLLDNGGIAAADCVIEDFNGDGIPDIACIGASTSNVKLYINLGR